jgi:glutamate 5-kinase
MTEARRKFPRPVRRIVIKVGSSLIATYKMKPRRARLKSLVAQISGLVRRDIEVVLVSSGAIVLGLGELNLRQRPGDLASLQGLAAIGQAVLMRMYSEFFKKEGVTCAQILLTWDDFSARERFNNARGTLRSLLDRQVVPVINENDTISTDEIKFGDNDKLSAFVASLVNADLLLILSDVEGFYDFTNGERKILEEIKDITREIEGMASGTSTGKKQISKGGMSAKLEAVKMVTHANIPCVIAHGEMEDVLLRVLQGERIGTFFLEKEDRLLARKHWISFGAKPKGRLTVDDGAKEILLRGGRSLLLPGVLRWEGNFHQDDVVVVCDKERQEFARGIISYSVDDLRRTVEKKGQREVVHCDNLVLSKR